MASLLVMSGCTAGGDPTVSTPAASPAARPTASVEAGSEPAAPPAPPVPVVPARLGRPFLGGDVLREGASAPGSVAVTITEPVQLLFDCTGSSRVSISTRPRVMGIQGARCTNDPPFAFVQPLELTDYPQRVVFRVRSGGPIRWRLVLDSELIPIEAG